MVLHRLRLVPSAARRERREGSKVPLAVFCHAWRASDKRVFSWDALPVSRAPPPGGACGVTMHFMRAARAFMRFGRAKALRAFFVYGFTDNLPPRKSRYIKTFALWAFIYYNIMCYNSNQTLKEVLYEEVCKACADRHDRRGGSRRRARRM